LKPVILSFQAAPLSFQAAALRTQLASIKRIDDLPGSTFIQASVKGRILTTFVIFCLGNFSIRCRGI
jgi:hypothetical protein